MRLAGVTLLVALALALPAAAAGPRPAESISTAIARIESALRTKGCSAPLRALFHSAYGKVSKNGCDYLRKGLGTFKSPHGIAYGTAAEIDAGTGLSQPATTVLALDSDRRFHVVFVQFEYGSIGSKPGPTFDRNARLAIAAIRQGRLRSVPEGRVPELRPRRRARSPRSVHGYRTTRSTRRSPPTRAPRPSGWAATPSTRSTG